MEARYMGPKIGADDIKDGHVPAEIIAPLAALSDDQRLEVFRLMQTVYCQHCGMKQPEGRQCQCWNDE